MMLLTSTCAALDPEINPARYRHPGVSMSSLTGADYVVRLRLCLVRSSAVSLGDLSGGGEVTLVPRAWRT
jgi:hypothetical protein